MKIKYSSGDIFLLPLDNNNYAICQIVWAPKGDYKKVFSFCVLEKGTGKSIEIPEGGIPILLDDNGNKIKVIFSSVKKIVNGEWEIIGNRSLSPDSLELMLFNLAGDLHEGDKVIRKLSINEYSQYPSMSVFGFELIQNILLNS
ncbi:hypothetical protein OI69_18735 [Pectobacterium fontis]|uniref:Immunity protein 26 n=1 Tax=Pectobacterium fontis TaxID=2558042 RepID=A0A7V8L3P5_9GAMM|nr:hypothetical protein OI69_18735 [Pectobacterium fontis]